MKKELKDYSKEELIKLRLDIDNQLNMIEIKSKIIKNDTLLSLESGDKIFGIRLSFGGHTLEDREELIGKVDTIDYCNVNFNDIRKDSFRISISHEKVPFGITTTIEKSLYNDEYCLLILDTMKSGYDSFFTLRPNTWQEDLKIEFEKIIKWHKLKYRTDLKIYEDKYNLFLQSTDDINQLILNK